MDAIEFKRMAAMRLAELTWVEQVQDVVSAALDEADAAEAETDELIVQARELRWWQIIQRQRLLALVRFAIATNRRRLARNAVLQARIDDVLNENRAAPHYMSLEDLA